MFLIKIRQMNRFGTNATKREATVREKSEAMPDEFKVMKQEARSQSQAHLNKHKRMFATLLACLCWDCISIMSLYLVFVGKPGNISRDDGLSSIMRNPLHLHLFFVWSFYYQMRSIKLQ